MGRSGSGINEENHIVSGSWIAWLIDYSIGTILFVPFCPLPFFLEPSEVVPCCRVCRPTANLTTSEILFRIPDTNRLPLLPSSDYCTLYSWVLYLSSFLSIPATQGQPDWTSSSKILTFQFTHTGPGRPTERLHENWGLCLVKSWKPERHIQIFAF